VTESAPETQPDQDHGKAAPRRPRAYLCLKTPDELSMLAGLKSILECFLQALAVIACTFFFRLKLDSAFRFRHGAEFILIRLASLGRQSRDFTAP
jgi:hypothetical protein